MLSKPKKGNVNLLPPPETPFDPDKPVDILHSPVDFFTKEVKHFWIYGYQVYNPYELVTVVNKKGYTELKQYKKKIKASIRRYIFRADYVVVVSSSIRSLVIPYHISRVRPHDPQTAVPFHLVYPVIGKSSQHSSEAESDRLKGLIFDAEKEDLRIGAEAFGEDWDKIEEGTVFVDYDE